MEKGKLWICWYRNQRGRRHNYSLTKHAILNDPILLQEQQLKIQLDELYTRQDLIWRQKLRKLWVKEGDINTKYFRTSTLIRRKSNHIAAIPINDGEWKWDRKSIGNKFVFILFSRALPNFFKPKYSRHLRNWRSLSSSDFTHMRMRYL